MSRKKRKIEKEQARQQEMQQQMQPQIPPQRYHHPAHFNYGPPMVNRPEQPQAYHSNYAPPMPPEGARVAQAPVKFRARWRRINNNGPVPVAPPADFIQLTPIVQPIPLVPYSTQMQPLATFDDEEDYDDFY